MRTIINLKSRNNHHTTLHHIPGTSYGDYLASYDALILSCEGKETDVGMFRDGVAEELGVSSEIVTRWSERLHSEFETVSIVCLKSRRPESNLKGIVLAPGECSIAFQRLRRPSQHSPYRDFYYSVAYEAIYFVAHELNAKQIGLAHWSSNCQLHSNMGACIAEALGHYVDTLPRDTAGITRFAFVGPRISTDSFSEIYVPGSCPDEAHMPIQTARRNEADATIIELSCFSYR